MPYALRIAALLVALSTSALAQDGAFYAGKAISYIVATGPGGGYDAHGRLVARFMQKYLPGATVAVKNVPGDGHLIGATMLYNARPDGLVIGTFGPALLYRQIVGDPKMKIDVARLSWIGAMAPDPRLVVVATRSGIADWKTLLAQARPLPFAVANPGSASSIETSLLAAAFAPRIVLRAGFMGQDDQAALRRGDVTGIFGARAAIGELLTGGVAVALAQIGGSAKETPQLATLAGDARARRIAAVLRAQADLARPTAAPPDVEPAALRNLREAYRRSMEDRDFIVEATTLGRAVEALSADDVAFVAREALDQDADSAAMVRSAMGRQ